MKTTQESPSPYFNARRSWNDHVGRVVTATKVWQAVGIGSLVVTGIAVVGLVSVAKQSRFVPYIVEVDKLGQVAAVRQASAIDPASLTSVTKAELASFITRARLVTPDQQLQATAIREVYALLANSDPATAKMNEWFNGTRENNPFARAEKVLVSTSINSVIPQSADSWQVDWTETVVSRDGHPESVANMRALITTYLVPATAATTEAEIQRNPIGLYVKDFNWSKIGF
ncbi:MAG: conjugal transfer protein TrbF [Rhodospirillales bacterium]|nr:conjugal transfer protein TrbF [Acetobacter sp.]